MATNYNYFGNLVTSGLVLDLDAAKLASYPGTGTTWYDISGNNYSGSLTNGPTFTGIGKQAAIVFDGSDDIAIMNSGSYYIKNSGEPITVNTWIKPGRLGGQYQDIIANRLNTEYNWILYQHASSGSLGFHGANQNKSTYTPITGSWINAAVTVTPSKISTLYVNGSPYQTTSSFEYGPNSQNRLSIGNGEYQSSFEPYLGSVSVVQIYNRAISQFEVWQNFNALKGRYGIPDIVTNGLVLNLDAGNPYSYLSGSSGTKWTNTVAVSSSISGTLVNGTTYSNGSMVFDGVDDLVLTSNYTYSSTSYSQFAWFKFTSHLQTYEYIFDQETSRIIFAIRIAGTDCLGVYNSNQGDWRKVDTSAHLDGKWKYIGVTNSNGSLNFYINGVSIGTSSIALNSTNVSNPISIGGYYGGGGASQSISSPQIYNRTLSAAEVLQNFNALRGRYGI
jgi:hypothetical protein